MSCVPGAKWCIKGGSCIVAELLVATADRIMVSSRPSLKHRIANETFLNSGHLMRLLKEVIGGIGKGEDDLSTICFQHRVKCNESNPVSFKCVRLLYSVRNSLQPAKERSAFLTRIEIKAPNQNKERLNAFKHLIVP